MVQHGGFGPEPAAESPLSNPPVQCASSPCFRFESWKSENCRCFPPFCMVSALPFCSSRVPSVAGSCSMVEDQRERPWLGGTQVKTCFQAEFRFPLALSAWQRANRAVAPVGEWRGARRGRHGEGRTLPKAETNLILGRRLRLQTPAQHMCPIASSGNQPTNPMRGGSRHRQGSSPVLISF